MKSKNIRFLTYTAVMLAFTLLFQMARMLFPAPNAEYVTYIIGTLVNLSLIVAAACVNVWSGLIIALLAPIVAFFQGHAQLPLVFPIIVGNAAIVIGSALGFKSPSRLWIAFVSAPVKYALIALGMATFMLVGLQGLPFSAALPTAFTKQLVQLITGLVGIVVAIPVVAGVRRAIKPL